MYLYDTDTDDFLENRLRDDQPQQGCLYLPSMYLIQTLA